MTRREAAQFRSDPIGFLERAFAAHGDGFWLPGRQFCVAEPTAARAVLTNEDGLYEDHSDFFHTRRGQFGPRAAQIKIGRSSRALLRSCLSVSADDLARSVVRDLGPASEWPDAGNWLIYRHLQDVVLAPGSPGPLRRLAEQIVRRAVLAGARERSSLLSRAVFRFRVARELERAVELRRKHGISEPADLLDVVAGAAGSDTPADQVAEVFLSLLFATAGSIAFALGWSVYLLGTHPRTEAEPAWVIREALRLWPVAWLLGRRAIRPHEVAGVAIAPEDHVVVCTYLVHRHPRIWEDASRFRPERWASASERQLQCFLPFGWGPHRCIAGSLSLQLAEDVLRILTENYELSVTPLETRPSIGPALCPPRFTLGLEPLRPSNQEKGGDCNGESRSRGHGCPVHPSHTP